jgi:hypothetical protein
MPGSSKSNKKPVSRGKRTYGTRGKVISPLTGNNAERSVVFPPVYDESLVESCLVLQDSGDL